MKRDKENVKVAAADSSLTAGRREKPLTLPARNIYRFTKRPNERRGEHGNGS
jgi:hypothetical protein